MRQRRERVGYPFGTIKAPMGATHFLMKTLPRVAAEMALHVLAYNLTAEAAGIGRAAGFRQHVFTRQDPLRTFAGVALEIGPDLE
jgi:hypothetical protein